MQPCATSKQKLGKLPLQHAPVEAELQLKVIHLRIRNGTLYFVISFNKAKKKKKAKSYNSCQTLKKCQVKLAFTMLMYQSYLMSDLVLMKWFKFNSKEKST